MTNNKHQYKSTGQRLIQGTIVIALLSFILSCAEDDAKVEATYSSLWTNVFSSCADCHAPGIMDETTGGPDFSSKELFYNNTYEKGISSYPNWTSRTTDCDNLSFIKAGDVNQSTLAAALIESVSNVVENTYSCSAAYGVHVGNSSAISDADVESAVKTWIQEGALNN